MNQDEYGTILNGHDTFQEIALALATDGVAFVPWTDELGTQFDILLVWKPVMCAPSSHLVQRGIRPNDLFVSIMSHSAFGFDLKESDTFAGYYGEKLKLGSNESTDRLAELLNGVKAALKAEIGMA